MDFSPYDHLAGKLEARKQAYLRSIAAWAERDRPALSRGFLKGVPGNKVNVSGQEERPTATDKEKQVARVLRNKNQAFWEDTPALRASPGDPFEEDDINAVIARLKAADLTRGEPDALEFPRFCRKFPFWGQNPTIGYQQCNALQTRKLSKKRICDRTLADPKRKGGV